MTFGKPLAITILACWAATPVASIAQDAAETATILSGSGPAQARAQRSQGGSIARAMGNAANAVAAANNVRSQGAPRRAGVSVPRQGYSIAGNVDPLKGTDAATYRLGNGASISVSGRMTPSGAAVCTKDCPEQP